MRKVKIKTLYEGKAWIADKYLEKLAKGETLVLEHDDELMTLTKLDVKTLKQNKSEKAFKHQYGSGYYHLWGIKWKKDVEKQASLFS